MASKSENLTVREKYIHLVRLLQKLEEFPGRQDLDEFQRSVASTLKEFSLLQAIVDSLTLFSENEQLKEINTSYLSFLAVPYYESCLYMKLLADVSNGYAYDSSEILKYKSKNLQTAKEKLAVFLHQLDTLGGVLSKEQVQKLDGFKNSYNPSIEEINSLAGNPVTRRTEKIANFNLERELKRKLQILDDYYRKSADDEDIFSLLDEEVVRTVFIDQLKLFSLHAFENLELVALELQVLLNKPAFDSQKAMRDQRKPEKEEEDQFGYTTRVESNPNQPKKISDLINKHGKILQTFTITNTKQDLRSKVFGTGQVLPSMTVEEYLDYELANGKMLKEEAKDTAFSSDEENSDEELEKRQWDDWKDDHPKGSGNMKGNIS